MDEKKQNKPSTWDILNELVRQHPIASTIVSMAIMIAIKSVIFPKPKAAPPPPPPQQTITQQTTSQQAQGPTLEVNPYEFRERYNEFLHSSGGMIGETGGLDIGEPYIKSGSINDAVSYANNDLNLALNQTIDKRTGEMKEVFLTSTIAGKDTKTIQASLITAIISYNALIYAVDPEADIDVIQENLGLHKSASEWATDTETIHNDVKYYKRVVKGIGMVFGASAQ